MAERHPLPQISCLLLSLILSATLPARILARDDAKVSFRDQIGPIFLSRCVECHAGATPAAGLDLTRSTSLLRGGKSGRAIVPGDADSSLLIEVLSDGKMPPRAADRLTSDQRSLIERWIDQGATWEGPSLEPGSITTDRRAGLDWWSLQPIRRPAVPSARPGQNPIDAFLDHERSKLGLSAAPVASRPTLIRRMTFDLLGIPPTPEEIEAYVADTRVDATERVVDRLLASPHYGERWARHWLDVVRFAESHGYEHDSPRPNAWAYRDYVIKSWNADLPYNQFVTEQIAGDVVAPRNRLALAATGFLVAGPFDEVGSKVTSALMRANVRQDELEDLIGVTSQTFLGLTLQCARCHDHKFDPLSQRDYYGMAALFAGVKHGGPEADKTNAYMPKRETASSTRLLSRGDVRAPGAEVSPASPRAFRTLKPLAPQANESARRRALAEWLTDRQNPLTARVIVNRLWQHHFGQGIVATPSDFGFNGARPTHPDLLDWLASELMDGDWRIKRIHRLILLSSAYQMSSRFDTEAARVDSDNRRLWRMSPRRLDAEEVRDAILSVSGSLNRKMGGPGFALYESTTNAGTLYRIVDREGEAFARRSIYRTVVRGAEAPLLLSLDCPDASTTTPARSTSTTPLQALSLWNDPFLLRESAAFAQRLKREATDPVQRVDRAYKLALGRPPNAHEHLLANDFIAKRGLAAFCRVLLNTNEFLFLD